MDAAYTLYCACQKGDYTKSKNIIETNNIHMNHINEAFFVACESDNNLEIVIYLTLLYQNTEYEMVNIQMGALFAIDMNCIVIYKYLLNLYKSTDYKKIQMNDDLFRLICIACYKNIIFLKQFVSLIINNPIEYMAFSHEKNQEMLDGEFFFEDDYDEDNYEDLYPHNAFMMYRYLENIGFIISHEFFIVNDYYNPFEIITWDKI